MVIAISLELVIAIAGIRTAQVAQPKARPPLREDRRAGPISPGGRGCVDRRAEIFWHLAPGSVAMTPPVTTQDLLPSEVVFIAAMQQLGFGIFQQLHIRAGELVLQPGPVTVRHIKFGTPATTGKTSGVTSELRQQIAEFFAYVREVDAGAIRTLEIRHGLPFAMEIELAGERTVGGGRG
jgi:hypothetical protein